MGQITDIVQLDQGIQYALAIKVKTTNNEFSQVLQQSRKSIRDFLKENGVLAAGVSFVGFYTWDENNIEAIIGYPVAKALPVSEPIELFVIPAGMRVNTFYQGPYDGMSATYKKLEDWVMEHGYQIVLPAYEYFYNSPKYPQELLLTKIEMVIAPKKSKT